MTTKKIRERRLRPETSYRKIRFESLEARKLMAADVAESAIAVEDSYDAEITAFVDDQALQAKEILIKCEDFPPFLPRGGDESEEPSGPCPYVLDDLINGIKIDTSRGDDNDELFDLDDLGDSATEDTSPSDDSDKLDEERVDVPKCGLDSVYRNAWWNESIPSDVDDDGSISVLDALNVINAINSVGVVPVSELSVRAASMNSGSGASSVGQVDINNDGYLTPIDALIVVNQVNQRFVETQSSNSQFISSEAAMELLSDGGDQPIVEYCTPREILVDIDDTLGFESGDSVGEPGAIDGEDGELGSSSDGIDAFWASFASDLELKRKA